MVEIFKKLYPDKPTKLKIMFTSDYNIEQERRKEENKISRREKQKYKFDDSKVLKPNDYPMYIKI